jgi:hypothetical protein
MSEDTIQSNENLINKFNSVLSDPKTFSVGNSDQIARDNARQKLITSITDTRNNISGSIKKFKDYFVKTYGESEWLKFNNKPEAFDIPLFLVTGISPNLLEKSKIPDILKDLENKGDYYTSPTFYKNLYDVYLKNTQEAANYYAKLTEKNPKSDIPNMEELYKILQIDLGVTIQEKVNTTNVNKRKTYYETRETDKMKFIIDALRTLYLRIFLILIFIKLYVYFLKQPISIRGIFMELITIAFLFIFPILLAIQVISFIPKYVFEYMPVNVWVKNEK